MHIGAQVLMPRVVMSGVVQVVTAASTAESPQDVVVHGPGGVLVVHHPAAFTFLQAGGAAPPPDSGTPRPDDDPRPTPGDDPDPALSPGDDDAPDPGDGEGPSRTPMTVGSPFTLPDGLTLDRIVSGPLAGLAADAGTRTACLSDPCDGVLVG